MTNSYKIKNSVFEWLKIIETTISVDDVMVLRMKITLTIWQHKKTSTITANGGFIQINKVFYTLALRHRSDFQQALSTLERLQQEAGGEPHVPTYSYKHRQWEARSSSSTWWNWQCSWWSSYNSESQEGGEQSLEWTRRPVTLQYLASFFGKWRSWYSICFVTDGSFTVDGGLLWPTGGVNTTPQMTRFRDVKVCNTWLQIRIDDHRIQSDFKYKSQLQNPEGKKSVLGIASASWNRARHQWQRDHQDPEHFQHSAHEHWHVSAHFSCLLVRFLSYDSHTASHGSRVLRMSSHPCMKCAVLLRPWVLHSFLLPHLLIHPLPPALLPLPWGR